MRFDDAVRLHNRGIIDDDQMRWLVSRAMKEKGYPGHFSGKFEVTVVPGYNVPASGSVPSAAAPAPTPPQEKPAQDEKVVSNGDSPVPPTKRGRPTGGAKSPVDLLDPTTGQALASYESMTLAARAHGLTASAISSACRGGGNDSVRGRWRYTPGTRMARWMADVAAGR